MADRIRLSTPHYLGGEEDTYSMVQSAPGPFVKNGDFLRLDASSLNASCTLQLNARLLTEGGEVVPFGVQMVITGTGDQTAVTVPLANGWLVGFIVFVSAGTVTAGQVFASVEVQQGSGTPATRLISLGSGEITNQRNLGPGGGAIAPLPALSLNPAPTLVAIGNPAAGAQFTATVPAATNWTIYSLHCHIVFSVAVATRTIFLTAASAGSILAILEGDTGWAATNVGDLTFSPYIQRRAFTANGASNELLPLIPMVLPAGATITSSVTNMDVADQWSQIALMVVARPS